MRLLELVRSVIIQITEIFRRKKKSISVKPWKVGTNTPQPTISKGDKLEGSPPQSAPRNPKIERQEIQSSETDDLIENLPRGDHKNPVDTVNEAITRSTEPVTQKDPPDERNSVDEPISETEIRTAEDEQGTIDPDLLPQDGHYLTDLDLGSANEEMDVYDDPEKIAGSVTKEIENDEDERDYGDEVTPEVHVQDMPENFQPGTVRTVDHLPIPKPVFPPYYKNFISARAETLDEGNVTDFLYKLSKDDLTEALQWQGMKLDNYFFHAIKKFDFIGELPISHKAFDQLSAYVKKIGEKNAGMIDPKLVPPALFLVSMVFCARYSNTEARNFWTPYAQMVWGQNAASQVFQNKMRNHFQFCRADLERSIPILFHYRNRGEVVRPVYHHAIIPHYLHDDFAEWLTKNFETFLKLSNDQLKYELVGEKFLGVMAPRLKEFITGKETQETALRLITHMINTIKLFQDIGSTTEFEQFIVSPIERSLWELIHKSILSDTNGVESLRRGTPHLDWLWDLDMEELILKLFNVRSKAREKPDSLFWSKKHFEDLKTNNYCTQIYPWKLKTGEWEIEPIQIPVKDKIDGSIIILSEDYDLEQGIAGQEGRVIFEREIAAFDQEVLFFRISPTKNFAVYKEKINSNGSWLIVSREKTSVLDKDGNGISGESYSILRPLQNAGFRFAKKIDIQLPVTLLTKDMERCFSSNQREEIIAGTRGKVKLTGLSPDVPPVYSSPDVEMVFAYDLDLKILQRTWLTAQRAGESVLSVLLSDLLADRNITIQGNDFLVDLRSLISHAGAYTVNIWKNLTSVLSEPVQFVWLPDSVQISEPRSDVCYSPTNPLIVNLTGIPANEIEIENNEIMSIITVGENVQVKWKTLKSPYCRLKINHSGSPINLAWNIDRVWSWVNGVNDIDHILPDQLEKVIINVCGKPQEEFLWAVDGSSIRRRNSLDTRGIFSEALKNTIVRDMVVKDDHAISTVMVEMRGVRWKLFSSIKDCPALLEKVDYLNGKLEISFSNLSFLQGIYSIYLNNMANHSRMVLNTASTITFYHLSFDIALEKGEYILEIELEGRVILPSIPFSVGDSIIPPISKPLVSVYDIATSSRRQILELDEGQIIIPGALRQLKLIHTKEEWLTEEEFNEGIKRLLPSWAVLSHPLGFKVTRHGNTLKVFPERVAYGGRVGMGHIEFALGTERMTAAAFWRPGLDGSHSLLRMGFPEEAEVDYFSELDDFDLWPVYQCKDCGTLLGSRNGSYIKLPPSVVQQHNHGIGRKMIDQFTDTLNDKKAQVKVVISQFTDLDLIPKYGIRKVVDSNFASSTLAGKQNPEMGELTLPIDLFSDRDYKIAVSEFILRKDEPETQKFIRVSPTFHRIYQHLVTHRSEIAAVNSMQRLARYLLMKPNLINNTTVNILSLCLILRLKSNSPDIYFTLKSEMHMKESELADYTILAAEGCPKLFEWCITWAELFCVHAIS